jgi:hypothetical protein
MSDLAHLVLPDLFRGHGPQAVPFRQNLLAQRSTARKTPGDKRRRLRRMRALSRKSLIFIYFLQPQLGLRRHAANDGTTLRLLNALLAALA